MRGDPPSVGETVAGILGTFTLSDFRDEGSAALICYACPGRGVAGHVVVDEGLDAVVLTALDHARTAHPIRRT